MIKKLFHHFDIVKRVFEVKRRLTRSSCFEKEPLNKRFVIESIRDDYFYNIVTYVMAYFIAQRAEHVYLLKDPEAQRVLRHHDILTMQSTPSQRRPGGWAKNMVKKCIDALLYAGKPSNITIMSYRSLLGPDRIRAIEMQTAVFGKDKYSEFIDASHLRYFGGRPFAWSNGAHVAYARESYFDAEINAAVADTLATEYKIDRFITMDGIYTTYGVLADCFRKHGCSVLIYQFNGFQDRGIFIGEQSASVNGADASWAAFKERQAPGEGYVHGLAYLKQRTRSKNDALNAEEAAIVHLIETKRATYQKTVAIFPNKTWDGAIKERDTLFESMTAWMIETIEYCIQNDCLVVLREHPEHHTSFSAYESSIALLQEIAPDLCRHDQVILVGAQQSVNSYKLVESYVDLSVVYSGTLGIEIAYLGKPVLFAGHSPYAGKGIAYEPRSKEEYFQWLDTVSVTSDIFAEHNDAFMKNIAAAAEYQFYENSFHFPLFPLLASLGKGRYKYWLSWDTTGLDCRKNASWKRTLEKLVFFRNT